MNSFLSFHSPIFHSKIRSLDDYFLNWGEMNLLKRTYVEGGIFETNRKEQGGKGDQKSAVLSERTFWMTPLCEHAK